MNHPVTLKNKMPVGKKSYTLHSHSIKAHLYFQNIMLQNFKPFYGGLIIITEVLNFVETKTYLTVETNVMWKIWNLLLYHSCDLFVISLCLYCNHARLNLLTQSNLLDFYSLSNFMSITLCLSHHLTNTFQVFCTNIKSQSPS